MTGEEAFREILSWKGGNFEILPADPARPRTINNSYQGLLLDTAQALDESKGPPPGSEPGAEGEAAAPLSNLAALGRFEGVSFVLSMPPDEKAAVESWSLENAQMVAVWARDTYRRLAKIGESIHAGEFTGAAGFGLVEHWAIKPHEAKGLLCVGFRPVMDPDEVEQTMNHVFDKWAS
jgi:hypothetical protein